MLRMYCSPMGSLVSSSSLLWAAGMKTTVSEAEHPLLCEGTRREKGDLALALMITYKDDQSKLKKVSFPLKGEREMEGKPCLGFDGFDSFASEYKLLCHIVMFYKLYCGIYIHLLMQNLIVQPALFWERHSFHRFLKVQSDVLSLLLLLLFTC